uniref:Uncharacterized protein n=1 Tax=Candidatus Kentrum sp. FM TaxID=2126340 RepID=A0A450X498_9GAMM|nr:MAG: hypothetical protein BECKFM1743B_GA0114221_109691 [Candidatus Kentron sp. FM]
MGECSRANTWVRLYAPPNVGANLVFAHYAWFALMPKSCGYTAHIPSINPESDKSQNNLPELRSLGHIKLEYQVFCKLLILN